MFKFYTVLRNTGGRNNSGSVTVRHRGPKLNSVKSFNYFNFKSVFFSNFSSFQKIYDANCFVSFDNKKFNFIFSKQPFVPKQLFEYKPGSFVSNIESFPGAGCRYVRAPCSRAMVIRRLGTNSIVKIPSGEIRKFKALCFAFPSSTDSFVKIKSSLKKAGASRNLGIRPHVRGCAMNPVDHPHGGRTGESRPSVSPWAKLTKGYRTRFKSKDKGVVILSVQEIKNKRQNKKK
jgi:large subunit ribosomal protein L2